MTEPGQPPAVGSEFGRYHIQSRIGMGGMGVVYSALDRRLGRVVALKVVSGQLAGNAEFVERFQREADVLARLDSPHIIAIFDHGEEHGVPYIATQYVAGGDLGHLLRARGPLDVATAVGICAQVADALSDAHRAGVVHRDVKAGNVLVRDTDTDSDGAGAGEPHVYLGDFGIAQTESRGLTRAGGVAGSWAYLAPERARGAPATPASDCYAVGCLLWVCLTGHPPYTGTDVEVALSHVNAPIPRFEGDDPLTSRLNELLARAMAKAPEDRHASAAHLRDDLRALAQAEGATRPVRRSVAVVPATPSGTGGSGTVIRRSPSRRRRRAVLLVAVATLLAGGTAAAVALRDPTEPRDPRSPPADPRPVSSVTGDFDGDGLGDLVLRRYDFADGGGGDYLLASDGRSFGDPEKVPGRDGLPVAGDVDGDGAQEVVTFENVLGTERTKVRTTFQDGRTDVQRWPPAGHRAEAFPLLADVDGDGLDDLVLWADGGEDTGAEIEVAIRGADGFAEPERWHRTSQWNQFFDSLHAGDIDGDGRADLVTGELRAGPDGRPQLELTVLLADDRRFAAASAPVVVRRGAEQSWVMVGDVDGDDRGEVVAYLRDDPGRRMVVYELTDGILEEGERWGRDPRQEARDSQGTTPVLVDVDGDGDDDLVLRRPARRGSYEVLVALAAGRSFGELEQWSDLDCLNRGCEEEAVNTITGSL